MKTNLLLLDSYYNLENLISTAFSFSKKFNYRLKIVYVFDFNWMRESYMVGGAGGTIDPSLVMVERNVREEFQIAENKIREAVEKPASVSNVPYDLAVSEINRIDLVNDELKENEETVLMISTHQSYTEASGGLIGYPNIVEHVKCPVFVIPENVSVLEFNHLVFATDYHPEDLAAIKHLISFAGENTTITVLHNSKEVEFHDNLKWLGFQKLCIDETGWQNFNFELMNEDDFQHSVEIYSKSQPLDLLAVVKEKRGFFRQIFTSSETKHLLTGFERPILVYHDKT